MLEQLKKLMPFKSVAGAMVIGLVLLSNAANLLIFTLGVFFMRAAGCAINDFADRDWDRHVKRTKDRPLTAGRVRADREWIHLSLRWRGGCGMWYDGRR